jgi:hypothetical protein
MRTSTMLKREVVVLVMVLLALLSLLPTQSAEAARPFVKGALVHASR